jgi:hypothetical protein
MRNAIPSITAPAAELQPRLRPAQDGHTNPRLQMRSWLASGQARQCQDMAHLLGVHRHPMGRWLALDAGGGLSEGVVGYRRPRGHTRLARTNNARQPGGCPPLAGKLCLL